MKWWKREKGRAVSKVADKSPWRTMGSVGQPRGRCWQARHRLDWAPSGVEGLLLMVKRAQTDTY